jgi:hypothetical protein
MWTCSSGTPDFNTFLMTHQRQPKDFRIVTAEWKPIPKLNTIANSSMNRHLPPKVAMRGDQWPKKSGSRSATNDAVALELPGKRCRTDAELLGGAGPVTAVEIEHRYDIVLLDLVERPHRTGN